MKSFRPITLILTIGFLTLFTSCSKEDESKGLEIIGTWENSSESTRWGITTVVTEVMVFNADNTGAMTTHVKSGAMATSSESYNFKYEFDGSNLSINAKDFDRTTKASVSNKTLTIEAEANGEVHQRIYTRLSEKELKEREEQREKENKEAKNQATIDKLIGSWIFSTSATNKKGETEEYKEILLFKSGMTGSTQSHYSTDGFLYRIEEVDFNYQVSDDFLILTVDTQVTKWQLVLEGNKLTIIDPDDSSLMQSYTRVE